MKSAFHQQLWHSSSRRKRGKHPTATDLMYLNSLFWLAEMSCSQITGTSSQLSATLHWTFPSKHKGAVSLTIAWKDLYRTTAWFAGFFIQLTVGWGTREVSTCNPRLHCQIQAQISYWFTHNRRRHLYCFKIKTLTLLYSINTEASPSTSKAIV